MKRNHCTRYEPGYRQLVWSFGTVCRRVPLPDFDGTLVHWLDVEIVSSEIGVLGQVANCREHFVWRGIHYDIAHG